MFIFNYNVVLLSVCCLFCHRGSSEVKFSVSEHLAAADAMLADDPAAKFPTDHIFTMTGIANQTMCVLSTESLPGIVSACLSVFVWISK